MSERKNTVMGQSILWACALIATSLVLQDSPHQEQVFMLLVSLSATSLLMLARRTDPKQACSRSLFRRR